MRADPQPRPDGKCVECGKQKKRSRSAAKGESLAATGATRLDRKIWLRELEKDPFCSRACAAKFYGITDRMMHPRTCERPICGNRFVPDFRHPHQKFCSEDCRNRNWKAAHPARVAGRCAGCAGDYDTYTRGCYQCSDRKRRRFNRKLAAA